MSKEVDPDSAIPIIERFISDALGRTGLTGYVVGLSGGVDSALSATLATRAVGAERILAVLMPYRTSSQDSVQDAMLLVGRLGISHRLVDISPMVDAYYPKIDDSNRLRAGNKMARERMAVLFDIAREMDRLVLGSGNRSETCLGYTTLYGDSACSVNPLGELYKTEVKRLAKSLGVPEKIINKRPSADLWIGQTDEEEIGVSYDVIDRLLRRIVDDGIRSLSQLEHEGFDNANIDRVVSRINHNAFKRHPPDIAPLDRPPVPDSVELDA